MPREALGELVTGGRARPGGDQERWDWWWDLVLRTGVGTVRIANIDSRDVKREEFFFKSCQLRNQDVLSGREPTSA